MYKAKVYVTLKEGVLDPQGYAVQQSLHSLNYEEVQDVRIGKYMELQVGAMSAKAAQDRVNQMCAKLLANPVIEDYRFDVEELAASRVSDNYKGRSDDDPTDVTAHTVKQSNPDKGRSDDELASVDKTDHSRSDNTTHLRGADAQSVQAKGGER